MNLRIVLYFAFLISVVLGILHHLAIANFWYWIYWWFDILTHFLGGFLIGLLLIWGYYRISDFYPSVCTFTRPHVFVLPMVLLVAVAWELLEVWGGVSVHHPHFATDTAIDLVVGSVGGLAALFVLSKFPLHD